jgi:hypothetical protein
MGKYLDWYLVELENKLDSRMAPEAAFELLNQTEDHILMIKEELVAAGMTDERAEQAAIQRFGELEVLSGKASEKPVVRANWASPVLLIVGGAAVAGASMFVGSKDSMIIAGSLWVASMVLSALLCCRRGRFPGLAFGILFAVCFAILSSIASYEFYGQRLDFVKRTDRAVFAQALRYSNQRLQENLHLVNLGVQWQQGKLGRAVPAELRTGQGILSPKAPYFRMCESTPTQFAFDSRMRRLFGFPPRMGVGAWSAIWALEPLRHSADAKERWRRFFDEGNRPSQASEDWDVMHNNETLGLLQTNAGYDTDNLFAGALFGLSVSSVWMLFAFLLNRLANFDWSAGRARVSRPRPRIAR